jgi:hypothetical protein
VAEALACDVPKHQPPVVIRMVYEPSSNRILPDVLQFLLQLRSMPYDVIETFIGPDGALFFEHLIYRSCRPPLDALKHLGQFGGFNQSEN